MAESAAAFVHCWSRCKTSLKLSEGGIGRIQEANKLQNWYGTALRFRTSPEYSQNLIIGRLDLGFVVRLGKGVADFAKQK
jgi:hypothetical protein